MKSDFTHSMPNLSFFEVNFKLNIQVLKDLGPLSCKNKSNNNTKQHNFDMKVLQISSVI